MNSLVEGKARGEAPSYQASKQKKLGGEGLSCGLSEIPVSR